MQIVSISDVHVKDPCDKGYQLLNQFMHHPKVREADAIFFLGDIFDFLVGGHREYLEKYNEFFAMLRKYLAEGKKIKYFEGNHDFHLSKLFQIFLEESHFSPDKIDIYTGSLTLNLFGKRYWFSHGEELNSNEYGYLLYKKLVNSWPVKVLANRALTFSSIEMIGKCASELSQKRHERSQYDFSQIRQKIRSRAVEIAKNYKIDVMVAGHTHIQEDYLFNDIEKIYRYVNNGRVLDSRNFISFEEGQISRIRL